MEEVTVNIVEHVPPLCLRSLSLSPSSDSSYGSSESICYLAATLLLLIYVALSNNRTLM